MSRPRLPASGSGHQMNRAALRRTVLDFGRTGLRPLPWRETRDPWAVLVSEVMLQQTSPARVLEPYRRFLDRFPTVRACAGATGGDVVRLWAGLGYNRRALNLHRAATVMVERHDAVVPHDLGQLRTLPGIGPYTARAVRVFAYETDDAVVDVNVARVLARAVVGATVSPSETQDVADSLVPPGHGWLWNQSIMEIGAVACSARQPACGRCALSAHCQWARRGRPAPDPWTTPRRQSPFAGSDRQGRGRLVSTLRDGPVTRSRLAEVCGWPDDPARARLVADSLVLDGLARRGPGGVLRLP